MPKLNPSSYIKGSSAKFNGIKGNLILSAEGLWFVPDDGGKEFHIPIEKIMDATIEGTISKKLSVLINGSNERYLFSVPEYEAWRASVSLAAGIYRRVVSVASPNPTPSVSAATKPQVTQATQPARVVQPAAKAQSPRKKKVAPPPPQVQIQTIGQTVAVQATQPRSTQTPSTEYKGPWPSGQDYEQSFQNVKLSMSRTLGDTSQWEPVKNPKTPGWYVYASGNYGSIYKIKDGNSSFFAIKCFTRRSSNLTVRYLNISNYLDSNASGLKFLAHFRFFEEGIKTRKNQSYYFPLLKMEWIDGQTLNKVIQANLQQPKLLKNIASRLVDEVDQLQRLGIAHGDLAGDNIIITDKGDVKLVDYDGMYIPTFKGEKSNEMGHADFQHPLRVADTYSPKLDNFSSLIIYLSLNALAEKPELWEKYNANDPDCLILRKKDFLDLQHSDAFDAMEKIKNRKVRKMCDLLDEYLSHGPMWEGASPAVLASL